MLSGLVDTFFTDHIDVVGGYRAKQHEYAQYVARTLTRSHKLANSMTGVSLLEADTGIGKTVGYCVAMMLHSATSGKRIAIATHTRHLQHQILQTLEKISPVITELTGVNATVGVRFGLSEYINPERLERKIQSIKGSLDKTVTNDDIELLERLLDWTCKSIERADDVNEKHYTGRVHDFLAQNKLNTLPLAISDKSICLNYSCDSKLKVCYQRDAELSKPADILLITHAMYIIHSKFWFTLLDEGERSISDVLIDEADCFADVAKNVYEENIGLNYHLGIAGKLSQTYSNLIKPTIVLQDAIESLLEIKEDQVDLTRSTSSASKKVLSQSIGRVLSAFLPVFKRETLFVQTDDNIRELFLFTHKLLQFSHILEATEAQSMSQLLPVLSFSPVHRHPSLSLHPRSVSWLLSRLYMNDEDEKSHVKTIIFTSATLYYRTEKTPWSTKIFERQVGIFANDSGRSEKQHLEVFRTLSCRLSPDNYGQMNILLASPMTPPPFIKSSGVKSYKINTQWSAQVLSMVLHALDQKDLGNDGRTLVLVSSFEMAEHLHGLIIKNLKRQGKDTANVICHKSGQRLKNVIVELGGVSHCVIITPSAWQGVDTKMDNLIVAQIPYAPQDEVAVKVLASNRDGEGKVGSATYYSNRRFSVFRLLKQGIGRLIRSPHQLGRLYIADPRFPIKDPNDFSELDFSYYKPDRDLRHAIQARFDMEWENARCIIPKGDGGLISYSVILPKKMNAA